MPLLYPALLVLRHKPGQIGLKLDQAGWADVDELMRLANNHGHRLTRSLLEQVVAQNDKQRFAFSGDNKRIRANQGHSIAVDLGLSPSQPPALLYHGTSVRVIQSIRTQGLLPGNRRYVHLSIDAATAAQVGQRRGTPVILVIQTEKMVMDGHRFFLSDNGVWLTERVPAQFIQFPRSVKA
ncbi:MAG: RNA 2'-phosphotransferase [Magnetococcales bacterium]|nr:RNA 2'-phosphotransferase [Magnetococcales bacterium]